MYVIQVTCLQQGLVFEGDTREPNDLLGRQTRNRYTTGWHEERGPQ